tara:strand:+ start:3869 stop:4282 length:414 start_codon:yes stop_codon:yes gene_type:complete
MEKSLLLYPAIFMMVLTLFLYTKNYLDNIRAKKSNDIKYSYFKAYQGSVPEHVAVSRQTLKNQFELPIFFYFLVSVVLAFDRVTQLDIIFSWFFVVSRYLHCYIRLTSNHVPSRAKVFQVGMVVLIAWWIIFLYNIL